MNVRCLKIRMLERGWLPPTNCGSFFLPTRDTNISISTSSLNLPWLYLSVPETQTSQSQRLLSTYRGSISPYQRHKHLNLNVFSQLTVALSLPTRDTNISILKSSLNLPWLYLSLPETQTSQSWSLLSTYRGSISPYQRHKHLNLDVFSQLTVALSLPTRDTNISISTSSLNLPWLYLSLPETQTSQSWSLLSTYRGSISPYQRHKHLNLDVFSQLTVALSLPTRDTNISISTSSLNLPWLYLSLPETQTSQSQRLLSTYRGSISPYQRHKHLKLNVFSQLTVALSLPTRDTNISISTSSLNLLWLYLSLPETQTSQSQRLLSTYRGSISPYQRHKHLNLNVFSQLTVALSLPTRDTNISISTSSLNLPWLYLSLPETQTSQSQRLLSTYRGSISPYQRHKHLNLKVFSQLTVALSLPTRDTNISILTSSLNLLWLYLSLPETQTSQSRRLLSTYCGSISPYQRHKHLNLDVFSQLTVALSLPTRDTNISILKSSLNLPWLYLSLPETQTSQSWSLLSTYRGSISPYQRHKHLNLNVFSQLTVALSLPTRDTNISILKSSLNLPWLYLSLPETQTSQSWSLLSTYCGSISLYQRHKHLNLEVFSQLTVALSLPTRDTNISILKSSLNLPWLYLSLPETQTSQSWSLLSTYRGSISPYQRHKHLNLEVFSQLTVALSLPTRDTNISISTSSLNLPWLYLSLPETQTSQSQRLLSTHRGSISPYQRHKHLNLEVFSQLTVALSLPTRDTNISISTSSLNLPWLFLSPYQRHKHLNLRFLDVFLQQLAVVVQ